MGRGYNDPPPIFSFNTTVILRQGFLRSIFQVLL